MSKFDEILNSSDASDALLGEQIDKLQTKLPYVSKTAEVDKDNSFSFEVGKDKAYMIFTLRDDATFNGVYFVGYGSTASAIVSASKISVTNTSNVVTITSTSAYAAKVNVYRII